MLAKGLEFALAAGRAEASEKDLEKARKEIALAQRLGSPYLWAHASVLRTIRAIIAAFGCAASSASSSSS